MKSWVFVGVSLFIASASPVLAQTAPTDSASAAPADDASSGEIIVTANKRAERQHDVPASISAVTGDTLGKLAIISPQELVQISPALSFQAQQEARNFNFSIRGIGTVSFSVGVEPSVSTIVDGVVLTRPGATFNSLNDIERIEVLSGPQGTLQGKNASAGVVNIVTARPNRTEFEGRAEVTVAAHNEVDANVMLTGPISDTLAFRLTGFRNQTDGVVTNIATGKPMNNSKSYGARGKLEWNPQPGIDFMLIGDFAHIDADCCAEPIRVAGSGAPFNVTAAYTGTPVGPLNTFVNYNSPQVGHQKNMGVSLESNIDIGTHKLTSITAYRFYEDFAIHDRDGTNAPFTGVTSQQLYPALSPAAAEAAFIANNLVNPASLVEYNGVAGALMSRESSKTFSQELRIASPVGGLVDYIGGLFFYDSKVERDLAIGGVLTSQLPAGTDLRVNPNPVIPAAAYRFSDLITIPHTKNYSAFASFNIHPAPGLTLTAGGRYIKEDLTWFYNKRLGPNGDMFNTTFAGSFTQKFSDSAVIGKFAVKYEFNRDVLAYALVATGYKGEAVNADITLLGTPNVANPSAGTGEFGRQPVAPEKSRTIEGGIKAYFFDHKLGFNIAYYDTVFRGYQTNSSGADGSGAPVLQSAGKLFTHGVEGDITVRPDPHVTLGGNFLFSTNKFGDLFATTTINVVGGTPVDAPRKKIGGYIQLNANVGEWGLGFTGNYTWTDKTLFVNLADANNPNSLFLRPSFGVANASISISSPGNKYRLQLFAKNLFNTHYVSGFDRISGTVGGGGAVTQVIPRDFNRYFGGTLTAHF